MYVNSFYCMEISKIILYFLFVYCFLSVSPTIIWVIAFVPFPAVSQRLQQGLRHTVSARYRFFGWKMCEMIVTLTSFFCRDRWRALGMCPDVAMWHLVQWLPYRWHFVELNWIFLGERLNLGYFWCWTLGRLKLSFSFPIEKGLCVAGLG